MPIVARPLASVNLTEYHDLGCRLDSDPSLAMAIRASQRFNGRLSGSHPPLAE
jgi:hypothetical protein